MQLCRPLLEGTRKALSLAGGDASAQAPGSLDVMASGMRLRRVLQHRLAGCFVAAHQVMSNQYSKVCRDLASVGAYLDSMFVNAWELELSTLGGAER